MDGLCETVLNSRLKGELIAIRIVPHIGGLDRVEFTTLKLLENILVKIFDTLEGQIEVAPFDLRVQKFMCHLSS